MTDIVHYCRHHGGPRGTEAADEIERLKDMANVGTDLMEALKDYGEHPRIKGWHPADCPTEIVGTLLNALDEQSAKNERLREALTEAIEVLDSLNDDEIAEELLPRLRAALSTETSAEAASDAAEQLYPCEACATIICEGDDHVNYPDGISLCRECDSAG